MIQLNQILAAYQKKYRTYLYRNVYSSRINLARAALAFANRFHILELGII